MKVSKTELPGLLIIEPQIFADERGFFLENYNFKKYSQFGINDTFVQDNHSKSVKDTIRGLHYQVNPGQAKLVRVISGEVLDVAVDIRFGSPTFGKWMTVSLSAENKKQIYIPTGFAHGFCVLSDFAEFEYKCSGYYDPPSERGICWDDPHLAIDWPAKNPIISEKDRKNTPFENIGRDFVFNE